MFQPDTQKTADFTLRLITQDENNNKNKIKSNIDTKQQISGFARHPYVHKTVYTDHFIPIELTLSTLLQPIHATDYGTSDTPDNISS